MDIDLEVARSGPCTIDNVSTFHLQIPLRCVRIGKLYEHCGVIQVEGLREIHGRFPSYGGGDGCNHQVSFFTLHHSSQSCPAIVLAAKQNSTKVKDSFILMKAENFKAQGRLLKTFSKQEHELIHSLAALEHRWGFTFSRGKLKQRHSKGLRNSHKPLWSPFPVGWFRQVVCKVQCVGQFHEHLDAQPVVLLRAVDCAVVSCNKWRPLQRKMRRRSHNTSQSSGWVDFQFIRKWAF